MCTCVGNMCVQGGTCWSLYRYATMTFALGHIPRRERVSTMACVVRRTVGLWVRGWVVRLQTLARGRIVQPLASDSPLPTWGSGPWHLVAAGSGGSPTEERRLLSLALPPSPTPGPAWLVGQHLVFRLSRPPRDATLWLSDSSTD